MTKLLILVLATYTGEYTNGNRKACFYRYETESITKMVMKWQDCPKTIEVEV